MSTTLKDLAQAEITRRASNNTPGTKRTEAADVKFGAEVGLLVTTMVGDRPVWKLGGAELSALAGIAHVSRFANRTPSAPKERIAGTDKDRRIVQMTDKQRKQRDRIYNKTGGGVDYLKACQKAGIPLSERSLKKLASMQTVTPVAAVEATV